MGIFNGLELHYSSFKAAANSCCYVIVSYLINCTKSPLPQKNPNRLTLATKLLKINVFLKLKKKMIEVDKYRAVKVWGVRLQSTLTTTEHQCCPGWETLFVLLS